METKISQDIMKSFMVEKRFYMLLLQFFYQPIQEYVFEMLQSPESIAEWREMGSEGSRLLLQFLETSTIADLPREKEEFNMLFYGPFALLAPPWESYYRSKDDVLFDDTSLQVRRLYHDADIDIIHENDEPDDHITVELMFMGILIDSCLEAKDIGSLHEPTDRMIEFLENHLSQWVPAFTNMIVEHTDSLFYKGVALLLDDFIKFDLKSLKQMKEIGGI